MKNIISSDIIKKKTKKGKIMAKEIITDKDVEDVATLSRLEFNAEEIRGLKKDLNEIVEYFSTLASVNTESIPATVKPEGSPRKDETRLSLESGEVVKNAPHHNQNAFIVPRVFE